MGAALIVLGFLFGILLTMRAGAPDPADPSEGEVVHGIIGLPGSGKSYKLTEGVLWSLRRQDRAARLGRKPIRVVTNFEPGRRVHSHVLDRRQLRADYSQAVRGLTVVPCYAGKRCGVDKHVLAFWPYSRVEVITKVSQLLAVRAAVDPWTREPLEELHVYMDEVHLLASARFWQETGQAVLAYFSQVRKAGVFLVWSSQHQNNVETGIRRVTSSVTMCRSITVPIVGRLMLTKRYRLALLDDAEEEHHALWYTLRIRRFRLEVAQAFETYQVLAMERDVQRERYGTAAPARRREGAA